jgi:hypothetical protein
MAMTEYFAEKTGSEAVLETATSTEEEDVATTVSISAPGRTKNSLTPWLARFWRVLRRFAGREGYEEVVKTRMVIAARPEACWKAVAFYEEMGVPAPWLLRMVLPLPLRVEGKKSGPGARVDCVYTSGYLTKRILELTPPSRIRFDVVESYLGLEDCVAAIEGSYVIKPVAGGAEIILSTRYGSALGPRWVFRPLEGFVLHVLHRHILRGVAKSAARK